MTSRSQPRLVAGVLCAAGLFGAGVAVGGRRRGAGASDSRWFQMSNDLLVEASLDGYFLRLSDGWETCLGWTRAELMAQPFSQFVHPDDLAATAAHAQALDRRPGEVIDFENRYRAKDGSYRWLSWRARSDRRRKYAVARDVTERKHLEHERERLLGSLEAMARTDTTTGLPNRRAWDEEVVDAIARARRLDHPLALGLIDFDDFKGYNDACGHPAGDALLATAAARWRAGLRTTDFVARYGGEEFAVLLPDCPAGEVDGLLERLRSATPGGQTVSVGVAYLQDGETAGDLVARADAALYIAKQSGRDRVVVSRSPDGLAA